MNAFSHLRMKLAGIGFISLLVFLLGSQIPASSLLYGQTVTFAGTQTTLRTRGLSYFIYGVAVDGAGNVFITDPGNYGVVELPKTATGYGRQTTLPVTGLVFPWGVAVDGIGDVLIADYGYRGETPGDVVELPKTATGYGPQATLPTAGLYEPGGPAVDSAGDVFISDAGNARVVELPKTATGYGSQTTLPTTGLWVPLGVALDSAGNVFIGDVSNARVVELPKTATGYGSQTTLPTTGLSEPTGVAVDGAGDVFIADTYNSRVVELPKTATGYGPQTTLPTTGLSEPTGVAVDGAGDVFITDINNRHVVEFQTHSVNFERVNICAPGQTTPAPCSETLTLNYNVTASGTLGTPKVLTGGGPNLDFTMASGSTCTGAVTEGAACTVNVTFTPRFAGSRPGAVQIVDNSGNVLATTLIYGVGVGPQIGFEPGVQTLVSGSWIQAYGLAVDGSGDLFVADIDNGRVLEEPAGGVERTVASGLSSPYGVALDGAGDIFISEPGIQSVVELPAGGGAQVTLPFTRLDSPGSIAVDTRGDVFVADWWLPYVVELPWMGTGYGPQINVSSDLGQTLAVAVDGAGNVYISTTGLGDIEVPFGCTDSSCQIGLEGCCISLELAVDGIGDLFVPSLYGTVVYEDPANGGAQTTVETGLGSPLAVAADSAGDVFTSQDENGSPPVVELKRSQSAPLSFGTIAYGRTATLPLTMTNIGNARLTITPSIDGPSYQVTDNTCTEGAAPGASCTMQVEFSPVKVGPHHDTLTLQTNGTTNPVVSLKGVAGGVGPEQETPLDFGIIPLGTTAVLPLTITNIGVPGTVMIQTTISGTSYKVLTTAQNTCMAGIKAGQSCSLQIEFDPAKVGGHHERLTITPSGGAAASELGLDGRAD